MLPLCRSEGIGVIPWSPLARGLLTRPWGGLSTSDRTNTDRTAARLYKGTEEADRRVIDAVEAVAQERGVSMANVSLAWLLSRYCVTAPIIGAGKITHLEDAIAALDVTLTPQECAALEHPYIPHMASFVEEPVGPQQGQ